MTPPDVLYRHADGGLYDDTARAWDARQLKPLAARPAEKALAHKTGCHMEPWPDLADLCPCTAGIRWLRARKNA